MIATPDTTPKARVWIDGEEVTNECFYADDSAGVVRLFRRNAEGSFYVVGTRADPDWKPHWP